jgi:hypothetical protein
MNAAMTDGDECVLSSGPLEYSDTWDHREKAAIIKALAVHPGCAIYYIVFQEFSSRKPSVGCGVV